MGKNPVKKAVVVSLPTIESAFVTHTTKGVQGWATPEYPALRVAVVQIDVDVDVDVDVVEVEVELGEVELLLLLTELEVPYNANIDQISTIIHLHSH